MEAGWVPFLSQLVTLYVIILLANDNCQDLLHIQNFKTRTTDMITKVQ